LLVPAQFLALAEETGLIIDLGRVVLLQACRDLARWRRARGGEPQFVSVNFSPRHFAQPDFEDQVREALEKTELPPEQLWVEITEGAVIDQPALAEERIARLRQLGVNVVVDDFGVGYSSLGYLQRFDFNVMKLDRSFVEPNHKNIHLLDAMVRVARGLGMMLVAEGLEEREQVDHLRALGVEVGQGYFFARPLPGDEAIALMDVRSPLAELDA
jgi:EAL domain-containing protein (putative c-di-GMP-specific phosphodiesterase class I)